MRIALMRVGDKPLLRLRERISPPEGCDARGEEDKARKFEVLRGAKRKWLRVEL
jgi:hypothetical protein